MVTGFVTRTAIAIVQWWSGGPTRGGGSSAECFQHHSSSVAKPSEGIRGPSVTTSDNAGGGAATLAITWEGRTKVYDTTGTGAFHGRRILMKFKLSWLGLRWPEIQLCLRMSTLPRWMMAMGPGIGINVIAQHHVRVEGAAGVTRLLTRSLHPPDKCQRGVLAIHQRRMLCAVLQSRPTCNADATHEGDHPATALPILKVDVAGWLNDHKLSFTRGAPWFAEVRTRELVALLRASGLLKDPRWGSRDGELHTRVSLTCVDGRLEEYTFAEDDVVAWA
jgi:hypothetical protein